MSTQLVDVPRPPCGLSGGGRYRSCHEGRHGIDHIRPPGWFGLSRKRWVYQEQVHVTVGVTVAAGRRTEDARIERFRLPAGEVFSHATPQLDSKISHRRRNGGSHVLPVELVDPVPPHLRSLHQPLGDQSGQASTHTDLRAAHSLSSHFAHRERTAGTGQCRENWSVKCGCDRPRGISHVHDHIV